jgi:dTDP-4-dehydrorhamnose 3,5-epimerase
MRINLITTTLPDLFIVETNPVQDERGFFLESYQRRSFAEVGLDATFVQDNHSRSRAGVLRGLHYQDMTASMTKLVRCTRGAIFDVAVDLRWGSPTFGCWFGVELSESNFRQLYVPVGFAHGFLVLSDVADLQYKCSNYYAPAAEGAVRWDDPALGIDWPLTQPVLSQRDRQAKTWAEYCQSPAFSYPVEMVAQSSRD